MKPNRDASALAASLSVAAAAPLQPRLEPLAPLKQDTRNSAKSKQVKPQRSVKAKLDTVQTTLRPERALLGRYIDAAAERSKIEGRIVSAQEIMLEVLESGLKVKL